MLLYIIMKYLLLLLVILTACTGCYNSKEIYHTDLTSFKDDVNESIIDGFYGGDTTNISSQVYLLK